MTAMLAVAAFPLLSLLLIGLARAEKSLADLGAAEGVRPAVPADSPAAELAPARSAGPRHAN